ncbi:helix-turn-helix domain-containing protein [Ornithinimicrobium cerasi]|uniref:helix-turn-helix domain-containing protein n=1 Tax=Ornithinimicrobium cerasi TaxID=2248773 RepID=UPI000EFFA84F|nr:helix-turn-helix transcriptional regulator [Ornithinimicrobium cerasi]
MHALRRYLQDGMDARGWQQSELARSSGLTRQRVSQMLGDDRELLPAVPRRETLQAIARAFGVSESTVTAVAFEAMGYDLDAVRRETDLSTATDEQLVRALADRLGVGLGTEDVMGNAQHPAPTSNVTELHARVGDVDETPPADVAARTTGRKSRAQRAREEQDRDGDGS